MADREYIINVNGVDISLPAWALDSTMNSIGSELSAMVQTDKRLLATLRKYSKNVDDIITTIDKTQKAQIQDTKTDTAQTKNTTKATKQLSRRVVDAATFLGNTDAPITSMVQAAKEGGPVVAKGVMKVIGPVFKGAGSAGASQSRLGEMLSNNSGVISDALFMLAGWNAGKLESFAKVQEQMIDNGAIMFESAAAFRHLRRAVNYNGVTYDAFAKTITANNAAISQFGGNATMGTKRFQSLFNSIKGVSAELGDFGLNNAEMLQQTGEFLEYQRLTGGLLTQTADQESKLTESFAALQIETAALASITGLTRSQAMQALTTVENPDYAVGLRFLEGNVKQAAEALRANFRIIAEAVGTDNPLGILSQQIALGLANAQGDMSKFSIRGVMGLHGNELTALQEKFGQDFIHNLENAIKTGNTAEVNKIFEDIMTTQASPYGSALAKQTNEVAGAMHSLNEALVGMNNVFGDYSTEKMAKAREDASVAIAEAGTTTKLLNDMTSAFLTMQNAITLPMDKLASVLEVASGGISKAVRYLTGNEAERAEIDAEDMAAAQQRADAYNRQLQNYTAPSSMAMTGQLISGMPIPEGETQVFPVTPKYFGGPVDANNPYIVGDGVDMRQAELFVPEVNGRIMNNRELQELVTGNLTNTQNTSKIESDAEREYLEIIEAKKKTLATLTNLTKYAKTKMRSQGINDAIDASGT